MSRSIVTTAPGGLAGCALVLLTLSACSRRHELHGLEVTQGMGALHVCTMRPLTGCEFRYGAVVGPALAFPTHVVRPAHSCEAAAQMQEALANCDRSGDRSEAELNRCVGEWGVLMRDAASQTDERVDRGVLTIRCREGDARVAFDRPSF